MKRFRLRCIASLLISTLFLCSSFQSIVFAGQAAPSPTPITVSSAPKTNGETTKLPDLKNGPQDPQEVAAFLDSLFSKPEWKAKAGAVAVSVVRDGKVLASKGYGVKDRESNTPVDPAEMTFRVGSVSKTFTAVAIMQLVDQGKVSLQDNIE